jgi:hypothetical protein
MRALAYLIAKLATPRTSADVSRRAPPQFKAGGLTHGLYRLGSNNVQGRSFYAAPASYLSCNTSAFNYLPLAP